MVKLTWEELKSRNVMSVDVTSHRYCYFPSTGRRLDRSIVQLQLLGWSLQDQGVGDIYLIWICHWITWCVGTTSLTTVTAVDYDDMSDFDSDIEITQLTWSSPCSCNYYYKLLNLCDIVQSNEPVVSTVTSLASGKIRLLVLISVPKLITSLSNEQLQ